MEQENLELQTEFQNNARERDEVEAKTTELLDILDEVRASFKDTLFTNAIYSGIWTME